MAKESHFDSAIDADADDSDDEKDPKARKIGASRQKDAGKIGHLAFEHKTDGQKIERRAVPEPVMLRKFVQAEQLRGKAASESEVVAASAVSREDGASSEAAASPETAEDLEKLDVLDTAEEIPYIGRQLAQAGQKTLEQEARGVDPASPAGAGLEAGSHLYTLIDDGEDFDTSYTEVMQLLGFVGDQIPQPDEDDFAEAAARLGIDQSEAPDEALADPVDDAENEDGASDNSAATSPVNAGRSGSTSGSGSPGGGRSGASAGTAGSSGSPSGSSGSGAGGGAGHGGAGGGPGNGGPGGGGHSGAGPGGPGGFGGGHNPNFNPNATSVPPIAPNHANQAHIPEYDTMNPAAAALVGGIIGYLIGRRRGRIKTEKRLLPIQRKLRKEVTNLQWQLQARETKIRQVAAEQTRAQGAQVAERIRRAAEERQAARVAARNSAVKHGEQRSTSPVQNHIESLALAKLAASAAGAAERRPAPEARQLHAGQPASEHLGHLLLAAEATPDRPGGQRQKSRSESVRPTTRTAETAATSQKNAELPAAATLEAGQHAETLNRAQLLSLSEKIVVDGSSLRQVYESHLISERGLRRLVAEYLSGGDLKKVLRQEVTEHEIDFERDPAMRDLSHQAAIPGGGGKTTFDNLLQKAADSLPAGEGAAFLKAQNHPDPEAARQAQQHQQRRFIDIALAAVIATLLGLVIFLLLRHG